MTAKTLNKEILENRRKELEEELNDINAALRLLEKLGNDVNFKDQKNESESLSLNKQGEIDINELNIPNRKQSSKLTLQKRILETLPKFGPQNFTVNHMVAILNKLGKGSDASHFKNRVSTTIKKLYESGEIDRVHKGIGNEPHEYRQKS